MELNKSGPLGYAVVPLGRPDFLAGPWTRPRTPLDRTTDGRYGMRMQHPCPICGRPAEQDRAKNPDRPFCSERCRMVDLSRWLDESYAVPGETVPEPASDDG